MYCRSQEQPDAIEYVGRRACRKFVVETEDYANIFMGYWEELHIWANNPFAKHIWGDFPKLVHTESNATVLKNQSSSRFYY